jgi:hypothetical protein
MFIERFMSCAHVQDAISNDHDSPMKRNPKLYNVSHVNRIKISNFFFYVFIWFSIIHHYLCQCQI